MRFSDILLEYNRDQTVKNFGAKVLAVAFKDSSIDYPEPLQRLARDPEKHAEILNYVMGELERSDPTRNKNYAQALTKMYTVGDTPLEDFTSTMANDLVKFDKLKNKKKIQPEHADFMRFKSARQFMDIIAQYPDPESELGSQKIAVTQIPEGLDYKIVYGKLDNQLRITTEVIIVQPLNEAASQWWARAYPTKEAAQTNKWCTGQPNGCLFNSYSRDGDLFIIIPQVRKQNDEKYQFYFSRGGGRRNEFAANDNRHLSDEQLSELATRFPAITYALKNYAVASNTLPLMPQEYKDKVGAHAQVAAKELDSMLEKFTERVARFGFAELRKPEKYGIDIPQETEEAMVPAIVEYISQVRAELMSENGLWSHIMKNLGSERNSSKIEIFLNSDKNLKQLMESSKAAQMVKQLAESSVVKNKMDAYHLQDVILRDPTFRICMTQIPKLYEKFLASLDISQLKEGKVKAVDIARQDYDTMTPQQFRGQYKGVSRDEWKYDNKDLLATTQRKPKQPRKPKAAAANTIEAYVEYYDKNDRKQFGSMPFPNEVVARKWAEKNNAIIHSIIPLHKMEEAKKKDADDLWPLGDHEQEFTSAKTSINVSKLPSTFGKLDKLNLELKGKVIADIGGGRYDNAVTWAAERGGKLFVYDPFNRSTEHNKQVIAKISHGKADIATCNNVLNVIKEPVNRDRVIQQVENVLKNGGTAYFLTYEGDKSGQGKVTQQGGSFQNNLPTKEYLDEVHAIFGNAKLKNGMIVAIKGGVNESEDFIRIKELIGKV